MLKRVLLATLMLGLSSATPVALAAPPLVQHEGLLLDGEGVPMTGAVNLRFALYPQAAGGAALWFEEVQLDLVDGFYSVRLGSQTPLDGVELGQALYLGIAVDGAAELAPRHRWVSVPFALEAQNVTGDIHPTSVSVGGRAVIDAEGNWVGPPVPGAGDGVGYDTPAEVLAALRTVDGAGSGVDADTLDGVDSSEFVRGAAQVVALLITVDGAGSGVDADRLDGHDSSAFVRTGDEALTLLRGVDGANSGLDADRLDGLDSSQFLRSDAAAGALALVSSVDGAGSGLDADRVDGLSSDQFLRADADSSTSGALSVAQGLSAGSLAVSGTCDANCYHHNPDACVLSPSSWTGNGIIARHRAVGVADAGICPANYSICPAHVAKRYCGPEDIRSGATGGNPYARYMWVTGWTLSTCNCVAWDTARSRSLFTQHYGVTPIATDPGAVGCPAGSHMAVNPVSATSDWNYFICAPDTVDMYVLCCNGDATDRTW